MCADLGTLRSEKQHSTQQICSSVSDERWRGFKPFPPTVRVRLAWDAIVQSCGVPGRALQSLQSLQSVPGPRWLEGFFGTYYRDDDRVVGLAVTAVTKSAVWKFGARMSVDLAWVESMGRGLHAALDSAARAILPFRFAFCFPSEGRAAVSARSRWRRSDDE